MPLVNVNPELEVVLAVVVEPEFQAPLLMSGMAFLMMLVLLLLLRLSSARRSFLRYPLSSKLVWGV